MVEEIVVVDDLVLQLGIADSYIVSATDLECSCGQPNFGVAKVSLVFVRSSVAEEIEVGKYFSA